MLRAKSSCSDFEANFELFSIPRDDGAAEPMVGSPTTERREGGVALGALVMAVRLSPWSAP
jgi:hypothetical protein